MAHALPRADEFVRESHEHYTPGKVKWTKYRHVPSKNEARILLCSWIVIDSGEIARGQKEHASHSTHASNAIRNNHNHNHNHNPNDATDQPSTKDGDP